MQLHTNYKISIKHTQEKKCYTRHQLYLEGFANASICQNFLEQGVPEQKYLSNNILYQANITPLDEDAEAKVYYGIYETTFKLRYANHKKSFNQRNRKSDTELSNKSCEKKDNNRSANITSVILG